MAQVDRKTGLQAGAAIKLPVKAATTANITLSGEQTIDGVSCVSGDRVLVKDQTDATESGIYLVDTGTWNRAPDFDGANDVVKGTLVAVVSGTVNGPSFWQVTTDDPIVPGTSEIAFALRVNALSGVSAFVQTLLDDTTAAVARATLGAPAASGGTLTNPTLTDPVINSATGIGQSIVKRKTADESVTSSGTLQDDDHLFFAIGASEEWVADFYIHLATDLSAHGVRVDISVPSGATVLWSVAVIGNAPGETQSVFSTGAVAGFAAAEFTSSNSGLLHINARIVNDTTAGNVQLQFAQNDSNVAPITFREGSHMIAHRIA